MVTIMAADDLVIEGFVNSTTTLNLIVVTCIIIMVQE